MEYIRNSSLNTLHFSDLALPSRSAPRPLAYQVDDYSRKFDFETLVYDGIRDEKSVVFIAPPLFDNHDAFSKIEFQDSFGKPVLPEVSEFDRVTRIRFALDKEVSGLNANGAFGNREITFDQEQSAIFAGKRVAVTMSKNNHPEWIADWAEYHVKMHGLEAVLLYNNNTDAYDIDILREVVAASGLSLLMVVDWPFKWGPVGIFTKEGRMEYGDSNFSQIGMLEHSRWKYLQKAKSVLNVDVDELVYPVTGNSSIFDCVEQSSPHYISFVGQWVESCASPLEGLAFRHRHYVKSAKPPSCRMNDDACKYAVVPSCSPEFCIWGIHKIRKPVGGRPWAWSISQDFRFHHFRGITIGWMPERSVEAQKAILENTQLEIDENVLRTFTRVGWLSENEAAGLIGNAISPEGDIQVRGGMNRSSMISIS